MEFKDFFDMVGVIPHEDAPFSPEQRKIINNEMFYRFILSLKDTRTIFSCSLDGSFLSSVLFDEQFSKARRNTVLIRLIPDMTSYLDNELWRTRPYVRIITVLDYLSGMSDSYAVSLYKKLKGISL